MVNNLDCFTERELHELVEDRLSKYGSWSKPQQVGVFGYQVRNLFGD